MSRALAHGSSNSKNQWAKTLQNYLHQSTLPLTSLVFIAIPLVLYEVGAPKVLTESHFASFLSYFGARAGFLPALAVVVVLLAWHITRKDPWKVQLNVCGGMAAESVLLTLPLIALSTLVGQYGPMSTLGDRIILSMGAGIYEEFIFRLGAITILWMLLIDLFKMDKNRAMILMVCLSGVGFSLYHYLDLNHFTWKVFIFRTLAGAYFSVLFLSRGYGVTAGAHISYNVFCYLAKAWV